MDSIKKKMITLSAATEEATARAERFEEETIRNADNADKFEEQVRQIQKKMQTMEGSFDSCTEQLFEVSLKLEEKEKAYNNTEGDVGGLTRRALLLEDSVDRSEERLAKAVSELAKQSNRADGAVKKRNHLENENSTKEEENDKLENQLKTEKFTLAESERKYDDIARKHSTKELELERSNERGSIDEKKIMDLEEELKTVGQKLQQLEVSEEKVLGREETYRIQIAELMAKLKLQDIKEENATLNIVRLNVRIDQTEEDFLNEKLRIKTISDSLNNVFSDMLENE